MRTTADTVECLPQDRSQSFLIPARPSSPLPRTIHAVLAWRFPRERGEPAAEPGPIIRARCGEPGLGEGDGEFGRASSPCEVHESVFLHLFEPCLPTCLALGALVHRGSRRLLMIGHQSSRTYHAVRPQDIAEPILLPDKGIWHPVADKVFENAEEYLAWYNEVRAGTMLWS